MAQILSLYESINIIHILWLKHTIALYFKPLTSHLAQYSILSKIHNPYFPQVNILRCHFK